VRRPTNAAIADRRYALAILHAQLLISLSNESIAMMPFGISAAKTHSGGPEVGLYEFFMPSSGLF
jgi:hypothetical protein